MSGTRPNGLARAGRAALAVALGASGLGLVAASGSTAYAADATTAYSCTGDATTTMPFGFEAEAPEPPATLPLYSSPQLVNLGMESAVPAELAKAAADSGADGVDVSVRTTFTDAYPAAQAGWRTSDLSTQQTVPLGDQSAAIAVPVTGRGTHSLAQPGVNDLRAGDLAVTLRFRDAVGSIVGSPVVLTCTTPTAPVSDTVWVSSPTYLDLLVGTDDWSEGRNRDSLEVGEPIEVHAKVSANGTRVPAGWVDFTTSDGTAQRVAVDAEGRASAVLAGFTARAGQHRVAAVFVPADPVFYGLGNRPHPPGGVNYENPVDVRVDAAPTTSRVRVAGIRKGRPVTVRVRVEPAHASSPGGQVRIQLRRLGARSHWSRTRTVDDRSRAVARFGQLRPGRYRLVVRYRGDDLHLRSEVTQRFRVRR